MDYSFVSTFYLLFSVAQLPRRVNQPDGMTMIAVADGNQVMILSIDINSDLYNVINI